MGKHVVQFQCHHCGHCCTDVVCLPTPWDVIQIVRDTGISPYTFVEFLTPDGISDVPQSDPTWLRCDGQRYIMALRRNAKGCFFRHAGARYCKAYASRPILCRLFPFRLHETRDGVFKRFTLHTGVECPRHRDGVAQANPLYALYLEDSEHQHAYHDLVALFNRKRNPDKRPENFIEVFISGAERLSDRHEIEFTVR